MPLPCPSCEGELTLVKDSRDGSYTGKACNSIFWAVKSMVYGGKFRWRLRKCSACGEVHSTIETVVLFRKR